MFDFNYYTPTKVVFGRGAERNVAALIREFGGGKVLIHYGGGSVVRSGLLKTVTDALEADGIPFITLGGAVPNPRLGLVYEGIALCKRESVDFLLAVGGGSVIDSAKAIGYGVANEGDVWDFYDFKRKRADLPGLAFRALIPFQIKDNIPRAVIGRGFHVLIDFHTRK